MRPGTHKGLEPGTHKGLEPGTHKGCHYISLAMSILVVHYSIFDGEVVFLTTA